MNEQLVMDLANNITWLVLFCLVGGMLIGWYATFTHYRQKEREREAVEDYKLKQEKRPPIQPPKTYDELQRDLLRDLQRFCDSYTVTDEDKRWTYINGLMKVAERHFPRPDTDKKED
jgi:hypothetical protein